MTFTPVITGTGMITPLGGCVGDTWQALLDGRCLTHHARATLPNDPAGTRLDALAEGAAREALAAAGAPAGRIDGLVVGTSKGPVESWFAFPPAGGESMSDVGKAGGSGVGAWGLAGTAATLAVRLGLPAGPRLTLSAACASGLHALARAAMFVRAGDCRRVLVVAVESSLHPLFVHSFKRLGVLAPEGAGCRPFDAHRQGFFVSEAAAAVVVEAAGEQATPAGPGRGRQPMVRIDSVALAGDATHLTGTDPAGGTLQHVLGRACDGRPVDLVHAHGTGTLVNDAIELDAIERVVASTREPDATARPVVYSHKAALGHSLGASGLVSIVLCTEMHRCGVVPGNVRTTNPLPTRRVRLDREPVKLAVRRSLTVAAGFGGATAAVTLRTP